MNRNGFVVLKKLWVPIYGSYRHFLRPRRNFIKRYGGRWALVTGGGDGIGEALCYQLASSGFNIIIISRTKEKMEKVENNLKNIYSVETQIYEYDFSKLGNEEEVQNLYKILD